MKLPKPGKLPGGLRLPAFHMKNGFLKKNLLTLIAAAVLLVGTGTTYGTLSTREADRGYDPVEGVNQDRYQVLVSGEGYKLTKLQEKNYKLQKKQNEVNAAQAAQSAINNPTTIRTSSGTRIYRTSNYRYRYRGSSSYRSTGTVFISTNIYTQKNSKSNWKAGDKFSFMVTAYTYQNGKKKVLSKDKIKVTSSKGILKHTGKKGDNQCYDLKLGEGTNKITITAKNNKKTSKSTYIITAGKSSSTQPTSKKPTNPTKPTKKPETKPTDPTDPTTPVEETVAVSFSDEVLSGFLSGDYTVTEGTTAYDLLKKINDEEEDVTIKFDGKNIKYIEADFGDFSLDREDEKVIKIYKEEKEITDEDEFTPEDEDYNKWCDDIEKKVNDKHRLGKDYPFSSSHWDYDPDKTIKAPNTEIDLEFKIY